jgi:DNA-binding PadR family transcriptional regulator
MRRMSPTQVAVLHAVADGVAYGFDVIDRTGLPSGTVYPALSRLERDGYLRSSWETEASAFAAGRPARRYYRVTAAGLQTLRQSVEAYRALLPLGPARARSGA